jgi:flagellar hook-associated protein 2
MATVSGLISGIDTSTLVNQLVSVEKQTMTRMQSQRTAKQKTGQSLQSLTDKLRSVQTLAKDLATPSKLNATTATVSDSAIVATTDGTAVPSGYSIAVTQLAKAQRTYSDGVASKTQAVGEGTLTVTVGQTSQDIAISATDTLESVAAKIGGLSGVNASIVNDGTNFRLQVSGTATGAANAITFSETGTTLGLAKPENQVVAASDAQFSIDGFAMTSATNTVTSAIAGVSLELKATTTGTSVSVATDPAAMKTKMKNFVTAINDVNKDMKAYSASQKNNDSSIQSIATQLRAVIGSPVDGLSSGLSALSQVGISTGRDGTLSLDEKKLDALLSSNPSGVLAVFVKGTTTTGVASKLDTAIDSFVSSSGGTLITKKQSVDRSIAALDKRIDTEDRRVSAYELRMRKQFANMEQSLAKLNQASSSMVSTLNTKA